MAGLCREICGSGCIDHLAPGPVAGRAPHATADWDRSICGRVLRDTTTDSLRLRPGDTLRFMFFAKQSQFYSSDVYIMNENSPAVKSVRCNFFRVICVFRGSRSSTYRRILGCGILTAEYGGYASIGGLVQGRRLLAPPFPQVWGTGRLARFVRGKGKTEKTDRCWTFASCFGRMGNHPFR